MKTKAILFILLVSSTFAFAQNKQAALISVSDIESVFGAGFTAEAPSKIGDIESYRFKNKEYTIQIQVSPSYGMKSISEYRKGSSPKTVIWKAIPNDPDGAMIEQREDGKDDLASTPAVEYIRNNKHVRLQILGNYYNYDNAKMPAKREEMRNKLAKLKRIP
jgi:hypothetical protein